MYLQIILKRIFLGLFILVTLAYIIYSLIPILSGPQIVIEKSDVEGEANLVEISGLTKRAKELKIFDRVAELDQNGRFNEIILKQDPYTEVIITATDKWGKANKLNFVAR